MPHQPNWRLADTTDSAAIDALAADLWRGPLAAQASLLQDPRWLAALADEPAKSVRAYAWRSGGDVLGYAGFLVHPSAVRIALGELTLFARPVRHLRSFAAPIVAGASHPEAQRDALAALLRTMRSDLAPDE